MKKEIYLVIILFLSTMIIHGQEEIITITGDGMVGINDTTPEEELDMTGNLVIDGVLYSDTFAPVVMYHNLNNSGERICTLPDANTVAYEVIIIWFNGDAADKVLDIQTYQSQTIDGMSDSTWNGEGRGKMRILPHNGHWIVLNYIDRLHQHVPYNEDITYSRHFIKLADGTLIQWGTKRNTSSPYSPISIVFLKEFTSSPTVTASAQRSDYFTAIGDGSSPTTTGFDLYIMHYIDLVGPQSVPLDTSIYGYWRAYGRWY